MSDIDKLKLRRLDLSMLMIFVGLMRHRKATVVAENMGLTQSTISHALRRLRETLEDELFLRRPQGLEPTAFAIAIEPAVRQAIAALESALAGPAPFDPQSAQTTFRLATSDLELATFVPALIEQLRRTAPQTRLLARALTRKDAKRALEEGEIDAALGYFWSPEDAFILTTLKKENYRLVARAGHPIFKARNRLAAYCAADHVIVSFAGDFRGIVDRALAERNLARRVAVSVPFFFPALASLSGTELVATLPSSLVVPFAEPFGLSHAEPPLAVRSFDIGLLIHTRNARNTALVWLRDQLVAKQILEQP
jgi:DNA-binding transcriptional LysR family regulator